MAKIRVGVLRGGPSAEYEISLLTGENVLKYLPPDKYQTHDILLSRDGVWHFNGFPLSPEKIFRKLDLIFNALHGEYGEDGKVQQFLETHSIPYTGSGVVASALAMRKTLAREIFQKAGLKIPRGMALGKKDNLGEKALEVREAFFSPWVVKPADRGSSVRVSIAQNIPELIGALSEAFVYSDKALAEEYVKGREATCGVLENFRGKKYYALPVVEIIPPAERFFDYEVKYNGETKEICPARFEKEISGKIQEMAVLAHQSLGLRHYSRSDFIVSSARGRSGVFILETNTLPGLTSESLFPKASEAIGLSFPKLLDHLATLALGKT